KDVLLVTSAAVGAGMGCLNIKEKPESISERQALAAIGQGRLMHLYEKLFAEHGTVVAQVLLTKDDLEENERCFNAKTTIKQILAYNAVPIINENDTVSYEQIKFGDNDTLSAMVANLVEADLLILLSDIDGLYSKDPRKDDKAVLIPIVEEITQEIEDMTGGAGSELGSGGMTTKIAAAKIAMSSNIPMILTNGSPRECLTFLKPDSEIFTGTIFFRE
ncbi:MAG: glutamate 5-kinase, partial [Oscillospiraceae bacterium]|nr:glutamate 5-kinase [Oscillospiraceae bacterium]